MKRENILLFVLLIVLGSVYRVWDARPYGFMPQIAMAVFAGAVVSDKKVAFLMPILSMFLSDALYQMLYVNGLSPIQGFYSGQITNYILFGSMVFVGAKMKHKTLLAALVAPTLYFLISNFLVWFSGGGLNRPQTFDGLMLCYYDALLFYKANLWLSTLLFTALLMGVHKLMSQNILKFA